MFFELNVLMIKSKIRLIYLFNNNYNLLKRIKYLCLFVFFFSNPSFSDEWITEKEKNNFWEKLLESSEKIIDYSIESLGSYLEDLEIIIERELENLENFSKEEESEIDIQDKIDSIRLEVAKISELKENENDASKFTLIGKSKKDYRIEINNVLSELEPVLFDGEIVNYSEKIRAARKTIKKLTEKKIVLNENLVFATKEKKILKSNKQEIKDQIDSINSLTKKSEKMIKEFEFDLKRKLNSLGIQLSREQIRFMTTRVDGDDLAKTFAIFDITKQISDKLSVLVKKNYFSSDTTVKYYGTYVILSEILGFSQQTYIKKIDELYLPALGKIEIDIEDAIKYAKKNIKNAKFESNKNILRSNLSSNKFSLSVCKEYEKILEKQKRSLEAALINTKEQITVTYSTYDTAASAANLVNLISQTQNTFNEIMNLQLPEIIPFENAELAMRFEEISNRMIESYERD